MGNACYREQPNTVCVDTGPIDKSTVLIEKAAFWYTTGIAMQKRIHSIAFYPKNSEKRDSCISERPTFF